jgi:glutamine amidotransferase
MRRLRALGMEDLIRERVGAGVPLLGICLGMQLLFERSSELEGAEGIGLLPGAVEPLRADGLKVPHIGWSPVSWSAPSPLTDGLDSPTSFYFVHSFDPRPAEAGDALGGAEYGEPFVCAVARPPLYGVQFHPEKSSSAGLRLLANFAAIAASN